MGKKLSLNDCVFICMSDGNWWTFWDLQKKIADKHDYYNENSISASMRSLRNPENRMKYNLPLDINTDVIIRKRISDGKGYKYRLIKN